jgi:hypothetical protein
VALPRIHLQNDILRYLDGDMGEDEKRTFDEHLATCEDCRGYLTDVKDFNQHLGDLAEEDFASDEPHPDSWTLVAYEAGTVDEETARHLRAHLLFCDSCQEEFFALRRSSQEESWRELLERIKEFVIDLAKSYGPGTLLGSIRIVAEQPVFAARGGEPPKAASKILEVTVGENSYSVEVTLMEEDSLSCDIAGVRTPLKEPLKVSARSGAGDELVSVQSDTYGNCHFLVPSAEYADALCLLTFHLKDREQQVLLRVPKASEPA